MDWLWIVLIIAAVVGYRAYQNNAAKNELLSDREAAKAEVAKNKAEIITAARKTYAEIERGDSIVAYTRERAVEYMTQTETQARLMELWSKHVTTVMASDKYSVDSRNKLYEAWYTLLADRQSVNESSEYQGASDWQYEKYAEAYKTFVATLEAFGYDGEKEAADMEKDVKAEIVRKYKNAPLGGDEVKKAAKVAGKAKQVV